MNDMVFQMTLGFGWAITFSDKAIISSIQKAYYYSFGCQLYRQSIAQISFVVTFLSPLSIDKCCFPGFLSVPVSKFVVKGVIVARGINCPWA